MPTSSTSDNYSSSLPGPSNNSHVSVVLAYATYIRTCMHTFSYYIVLYVSYDVDDNKSLTFIITNLFIGWRYYNRSGIQL